MTTLEALERARLTMDLAKKDVSAAIALMECFSLDREHPDIFDILTNSRRRLVEGLNSTCYNATRYPAPQPGG